MTDIDMTAIILRYGYEYKKYLELIHKCNRHWFALSFGEQLITCRKLNKDLADSGLRVYISCDFSTITFYIGDSPTSLFSIQEQ